MCIWVVCGSTTRFTAAGKVVRLIPQMTSMAQVVFTDRFARIFFLGSNPAHVATHTLSTFSEATIRERAGIPAAALNGYAMITGPEYKIVYIISIFRRSFWAVDFFPLNSREVFANCGQSD